MRIGASEVLSRAAYERAARAEYLAEAIHAAMERENNDPVHPGEFGMARWYRDRLRMSARHARRAIWWK